MSNVIASSNLRAEKRSPSADIAQRDGGLHCAHPPRKLQDYRSYWAAALIGSCARKKVRTRLMVRASSSGGSRQGKTVISAFGANEATSMVVWSGCAGVSSGSTRI